MDGLTLIWLDRNMFPGRTGLSWILRSTWSRIKAVDGVVRKATFAHTNEHDNILQEIEEVHLHGSSR